MSRLLMILLAVGITMCGTGCSYYKSANNPSQVTESPLVSVDSEQPANPPGVTNDITSNKEEVQSVKLKIAIGENYAVAELEDSATARDFMSLLPLKLTMTDYNGTEKVADLPRKLDLDGAPPGSDPKVGDLCTYTPWGNLAVFYKDFGYSKGLVPLAHIESGIEFFAEQSGKFGITIEKMN